jgi:hypothetical protein
LKTHISSTSAKEAVHPMLLSFKLEQVKQSVDARLLIQIHSETLLYGAGFASEARLQAEPSELLMSTVQCTASGTGQPDVLWAHKCEGKLIQYTAAFSPALAHHDPACSPHHSLGRSQAP